MQILKEMLLTGTKEDRSVNCTWIILLNYDRPTETISAKTGRGVRQGGCSSLILLNLCSDTLPRKPLNGLETS